MVPIFGGVKRPRLDGLTREEEKRRDALLAEIAQESSEGDESGSAVEAVLHEKVAAEPAEPLWPLLLGSQMMGIQRYGQAIEAFEEAVSRNPDEIRGYYGAGMARYRVAEYKREFGADASEEVAPGNLTAGNLYQGALRHFRRALELTPDKGERDELAIAVSMIERTLARKRGRL